MHASEKAVHNLTPMLASQIWATKEAVAKTLGTGFWQAGVEWPDIRVHADFNISFHGAAAQCAGDSIIELSIEQMKGYVVVTALRFASSTVSPECSS